MPLTRRQFLTSAVGASVAFARPRRSCVIIGAGLAGLAAAYRLKNAGWDVTVLEARNRTGGRVFSYSFPEASGLVCELGAEWIGASHERMQALCRSFELPVQKHTFAAGLLRDRAVSKPGEWRFSAAADAGFEKFRKEYESYKRADKLRLDSYDWWTWLQKIGYTEDDLRLRDLVDSTDFGESIRHVSAYAAAAEYFESSPENEMDLKITGGNSRLIEALVTRIGNDRIHTGAPVSQVLQRGGGIEVKVPDRSFKADACICTVPATALNRIQFDPPLPLAQTRAAEALPYSRIVKNSVLFSERFWSSENFSLVSDATSHYYFHSTQSQPGDHGILCSYAVGDKADVLASRQDPHRLETITRDLAPFSDRAHASARKIASYAWQRDPYTRGAYALYRPGQWFSVRPLLQRPHGKVLFAGEHLAEWQGFMEGAVVTGEQAADALL